MSQVYQPHPSLDNQYNVCTYTALYLHKVHICIQLLAAKVLAFSMALCLSFTLFFFRANLHKNWETLEKQPNTLSTTLNSVMGQDYNKYIQNKEINVLYVFETSLIFSY